MRKKVDDRRKLGLKKESVRQLQLQPLDDRQVAQAAGGGYRVSCPCRTMPD